MRKPLGRVHSAIDSSDRIGKRSDVFDAARHGFDALVIEQETIEQRARQSAFPSLFDVAAIRVKNQRASIANGGGGGHQCGVFQRSRRLRQYARRSDGVAPQRVHQGRDITRNRRCSVHAGILAGRPGQ